MTQTPAETFSGGCRNYPEWRHSRVMARPDGVYPNELRTACRWQARYAICQAPLRRVTSVTRTKGKVLPGHSGTWSTQAARPPGPGTARAALEGRRTGVAQLKPIIALFTDFGVRDAYVAQMKGAILSIDAGLTVLDLNHEVAAFNLDQASYLLEASSRYLPAGSVVVAVVDPGVGTARRPVLCGTGSDRWFVGPDNGLLTHVLEAQGLREAYELTEDVYFLPSVSATFHGRDIFGPVAAHLASGVPPAKFGPRVETLNTLTLNSPHVLEDAVVGEIRHIDHYGNIVTNVTPDLLAGLQVGHDLSFTSTGAVGRCRSARHTGRSRLASSWRWSAAATPWKSLVRKAARRRTSWRLPASR